MVRPRVQMVRQGSVGEKTGLMPGDIVTHVDGTPVSTHLEATRLIQTAETGVVLSITREVGSSQSKSGASPRRSPSARMASLLRRNSSKSPRSAASAAPTVAEQAVREDPSASLFEDSTTCRSPNLAVAVALALALTLNPTLTLALALNPTLTLSFTLT